MSTDLRLSSDNVKPWGKANPRRGAGYEDLALAFLADHEIDKPFTVESFDEWAISKKFIADIDFRTPKGSDAWLAHLQRRHQLKYNLNQAGTHPRMPRPFVIETVSAGKDWVARTPEDAIAQKAIIRKIRTVTGTRRKQIAYLLQSMDWPSLPPRVQAYALTVSDELDIYQERLVLEAKGYSQKVDRFTSELRRAIERGECQIQDPRVLQFVNQSDVDSSI